MSRIDVCVSDEVEYVGGPYIEVKTIELSLKYDCEMIRYMLAPPRLGKLNNEERRKAARSVIDTWSSVLQLEKTRQMNVSMMVPPANFLPGDVKDVYSMPCVVWIRKQVLSTFDRDGL